MSNPSQSASQSRLPFYVLTGVLIAGVLAIILYFATNGLRSGAAPTPTETLEGVTAVNPPVDVPDFGLTDEKGSPISLSDLNGKLTLLFFGYTHCPDYCPTTLEAYKRIRAALTDEAEQVQFVFVSVDGTRDTPSVIDDYLHVRGVSDFVIGMTGPEDALRDIGKPFGLFFQHSDGTTDDNYSVDHSTITYLLDRQGRVRALYSFGTPPQVIADNIRLYL